MEIFKQLQGKPHLYMILLQPNRISQTSALVLTLALLRYVMHTSVYFLD